VTDTTSDNPDVQAMNLLEASHLSYKADNRRLIKDISLQLTSGELVALIGPNGAGKSTLLRLLTGYLTPESGDCTLQGRQLTRWNPLELARTRAVMRQNSELAFGYSVRQIVSLGRSPHNNAQLQMALQQVLEQTDCLSLADRDYRQLSGGEQQRVQLARVLIQLWSTNPSPRWLFLDEPTSALDLYHQQHSLRLLHRLTRQSPLAVCCVLHDLNLAALYADRILLLHQGELVAAGSPKEVLQTDVLQRWYRADLGVVNHPESPVPQVFLRH